MNTCVMCGCIANLSEHHIKPKVPGKTKGKNKRFLCKSHHRHIHRIFSNDELAFLSQNSLFPGLTHFNTIFILLRKRQESLTDCEESDKT